MRYGKILVYFTVTLLILISSPGAESAGRDNDQHDKDKGLCKLDLCRADPGNVEKQKPRDDAIARAYAA
jgi:hypothetical protein